METDLRTKREKIALMDLQVTYPSDFGEAKSLG